MEGRLKRRIAIGAGAALAAAGGGAAIAATHDSPAGESQAVIDDAAKQLGIEPSALTNALKKALEDRVDAAVAAGRLTKAEGDALKQRIAAGDVPLIFPGLHGPGAGPFGELHQLDAAATYLGLTEDQLRTDLESGTTLAQVAKERGKSVDGLIQAMTDAVKTRLDAAVAAGRLTKDQEQSILSDLRQRITDFVNGSGPRAFRGFRFRGDHSFGRGFFHVGDGPEL